ncbi:MAG: DUF4388 domain-containing protein [Thermoanaerobaculia bacterium]
MPIRGDLKSMHVGELLVWIGQFHKSGMLELRTAEGVHSLAFEQGNLIFSASPTEEGTLGRLLIERGAVSEEEYQNARDERERRSVAVAKILRDLQLLSEEDAIRFLRKKAEKELFTLLQCTDGEFCFDESIMPQLDLLPLRLDLDGVLLRVTQHIDEKGEYDFDSSGIHVRLPKER